MFIYYVIVLWKYKYSCFCTMPKRGPAFLMSIIYLLLLKLNKLKTIADTLNLRIET